MRKLGKSWPIFLTLAALLLVLAVACGEEGEETRTPGDTPTATLAGTPTPTSALEVPGITDTEIILGADCPLTGATAAVYATIPQSTNAYFKYVNETQGGVCGREIVYKVEDSQDDPAKAVEAVRKLVEHDKVFAIVGSLGDVPHPAVWEYLNENEVPDVLCSAGSHMFGADPEGHPWTVQMLPSYKMEGIFYGRYISENLPGDKVAILYPNNPMGTDGLAGIKEGLDPEKNEIVSEQSVTPGATSARSEISNMKSAGADLAVLFLDPGSTAYVIKEADRLDWHPQWFISYLNSDEIMFLFVSPQLMEGAITFQALKLASWTDDPAVAEHQRILREYGGPTRPTNFTIYAQVLAETAVEVLSRSCDNLTREGLLDALESVQDFHSDLLLDGVNVSFSETDHTGLQTGRMLRAVVEDGEGKYEYFGPLYVFEGE
ncbi:MAG: ABC transporter substrate-binding protein [Dehalococcoidia bacterium]|nr:MAG: ABC transporter substrate-binding protein [Dehalococcoidia bacterium]